MQSAASFALILDDELRVLRAGAMLTDMVGLAEEDLVGRPVSTILLEGIDPDVESVPHDRHVLPLVFQKTASCADGSRLTLETQLFSLPSGRGGRWLLRMLERRGAELNRLKSDFIATVSHELRTPLSSVAGALGLVAAGATGPISADAHEMVTIALKSAQRLIRLIDDLLDIERLEMGRLHFEIAPHSLREVIDGAVKEMRSFADSLHVSIGIQDAGGPDLSLIDRDRAGQVLINLLSNAIKFSPRGGRVHLTLNPGQPYHRIEVIDEGEGIAPAFRPYLFDKFAQADGSGTRKASGTGLGLAICREIIDRLGGKIWFSDKSGGGTVFSVDFLAAGPSGA